MRQLAFSGGNTGRSFTKFRVARLARRESIAMERPNDMKQSLESRNERGTKKAARSRMARVHLEYVDPAASTVFVAGTFNDWHPGATEMLSLSPGHWVKEITLPPGEHEYRLVVDGEWKPDPACPKRVANPFGGVNSVIAVSP
jgi:1,4-alpha-glucan branching enzyme